MQILVVVVFLWCSDFVVIVLISFWFWVVVSVACVGLMVVWLGFLGLGGLV